MQKSYSSYKEIKSQKFSENFPKSMQCSIDTTAIVLRYNDSCVWTRKEPTTTIMLVYGFGVPSMAIFGVCANFINSIVFMRPKMTPSAFSYLAALSSLDCLSCTLITLTAFSRSILFNSGFWLVYDFQWQVPLFGITSGAANLVLACLSLDRLIYLHSGVPGLNRPPRFCRRKIARRMIFGAILISLVVNMPYFFIFKVNGDDKTFHTTDFYYSHYYKIHNWFTFCLLGILPAIFLLIGNAAILIVFCRWTQKSKSKRGSCSKTTQKRYKHQMKLTVTILIVITLYMFGELPAHLTSRKSILNLLYRGDITKVDLESMQRLEVICMILSSVQLSMNIIIYAIINPLFMPEFFTCLRGASDICFKLCGLSCCSACCHCRCCECSKKKKDTEQQHQQEQQQQEQQPQEHLDERRKSTDSVSSSGDNWDGKVPTQACKDVDAGSNIIEMAHVARPRVWPAKKFSLGCEETQQVSINWKRSNSFGKFAYDNRAMDVVEEGSIAAVEETDQTVLSDENEKQEESSIEYSSKTVAR